MKSLYEQGRKSIYQAINGKVFEYSCHKFASNVIEKCLIQGSKEQVSEIVLEVLGEENEADLENSVLVRLINDKFGNYVVQKCVDSVE